MKQKVLYILSSFNKYGGTPKKTMDLIKYSSNECFLYVWTNAYADEFKDEFEKAGAKIFIGNYKRNVLKHIRLLKEIINENNIEVIQTQFFFGELLGGILKYFKPNLKIVVAFVGPMPVTGYRKWVLNKIYNKIDAFVYVSHYVKNEKFKNFPKLKTKRNEVIYNGTRKRPNDNSNMIPLNSIALLDVAGLVGWKNIQILIEALAIIKKKNIDKDVYLYVAGDGTSRTELELLINRLELEGQVFLLGYQSNIGGLLEQCDIFVHPAYMEGFGIVIPEAMIAEKPIIVSDAGALPELIINNETGLVVNAFDANQWANAIIRYIENPEFSKTLARKAKIFAETEFSVKRFVEDYNNLYKTLLS